MLFQKGHMRSKGKNNGMFGKKHLKKTKRKISLSLIGNKRNLGKHHTEATKIIMSEIHKGNTNMLGKHHSGETKLKMSLSRTGSKRSEETKKRMSKATKRTWQNGIYDGVFMSPTKPEKEIVRILEDLKLNYIFQFRPKGYSKIYDFYIPKLNLLIEFDGIYWHKNTQERDTEKTDYAKNNNYKLLRVNEENLNLCKTILCSNYGKK